MMSGKLQSLYHIGGKKKEMVGPLVGYLLWLGSRLLLLPFTFVPPAFDKSLL